MELLAGETLAARLRRVGKMRPEEALPIVRQLCAALDAAHNAHVVHRDLKPSSDLPRARPRLGPRRRGQAPGCDLAEIEFTLAKALARPGPKRDRARAVRLAQSAHGRYVKADEAAERTEVADWLAAQAAATK
jgi:serine/threonine protein kinase